MNTFESQHCTACGLERRFLYSEPIARGYELHSLQCANCKTVFRMVRERLPKKKAGRRAAIQVAQGAVHKRQSRAQAHDGSTD
jgi:hypothetical protein